MLQGSWRDTAIATYINPKRQIETSPRFELAPLIDVVFILLIFFAVATTTSVNQKGIKLNLPAATSVSTEKKGVVVSVNEQQQLFFNGEQITEDVLRYKVESLYQKTPDFQVIINADRLTPYSMIVRLLDEVRLGGCFDIVLEAKKKTSG